MMIAHWRRQPLSFRRCDARGRFSRSCSGVGEAGGSSKAASRAGEGDASSEVRHGHKRQVTKDPKKGLFELPRHHYRNRVVCRVPGAHGKAHIAHSKSFAVCNTRQRAHGIHVSVKCSWHTA